MTESRGKVLIVDDNELIRRLAVSLLLKKNYEVATAVHGVMALEQVRIFNPDVILLDVMMPEMDGFECCRCLKNDDRTMDIPVIMLSSNTDSIDKVKGLETGAADYVVKPFDYGELLARVATQVKIKKLLDELSKKNALLEELVKKDSLTNLYNHRFFHERLSEEFKRSVRCEEPLGCIVCDIDFFKNINDSYGHQAGDEILKALSAVFRDVLRDIDIVCRYGGEEFACILPQTEIREAATLGEHLRRSIEAQVFPVHGGSISVTISIGVSALPANNASTFLELIRFADEALYAAKQSGRNRVIVSEK
jgi:two-component system, cell cycle response regulator